MGETTAIGWTDHTFNPWWGCTKIQAPDGERSACDHCYAAGNANRWGFEILGKDADRRFFGDKHWNEPINWERQAEREDRRHRTFCASMGDVFERRPDLIAPRQRLFSLIGATPMLDWQLLTKRPENIAAMVPPLWLEKPPFNVWMGTTVEDQRAANLRVPRLVEVPATLRFLSVEPLFKPVTLAPWLRHGIHWVIVGGESGAGFQPLDLDHVRAIRDECVEAGVPFFFKQVGGRTPASGGCLLDGEEWKQFPAPVLR